jgi:hypothetical protein
MKNKSATPRYTIQETGDGIQITLPGRKKVLQFLGFGIWIILWGFITGSFMYMGGVLSVLAYSTSSFNTGFFVFVSFISFLIAFMLFIGSSGIYWIIWKLAGKEIIEVNNQAMAITKQIFKWKRKSEYSFKHISNLQVNVIKPNRFTAPYRAIQKMLGHDGIINFNYEKKSIRFGLDISEDEGMQVLSLIKSRMNL